jgi:hypothetical protein
VLSVSLEEVDRAPPAVANPDAFYRLRLRSVQSKSPKDLLILGDDECHFPVGSLIQKGETLFCASPLSRDAAGNLPSPRYCGRCRTVAFYPPKVKGKPSGGVAPAR